MLGGKTILKSKEKVTKNVWRVIIFEQGGRVYDWETAWGRVDGNALLLYQGGGYISVHFVITHWALRCYFDLCRWIFYNYKRLDKMIDFNT